MGQITRQQLCAELGISESTVRRLELFALPFTLVVKRAKCYDLEECRAWLREAYQPVEQSQNLQAARLSKVGREFLARKMKAAGRAELTGFSCI